MGKQMTNAEIMVADILSLDEGQLRIRVALTEALKAQKALELTEEDLRTHADKKEERARQAAARTQIIEDENDRLTRERGLCKHLTGGKGMAGLLNGDGRQGASISKQILPTGELYAICVRCTREWRKPSKRAVIEGKMTFEAYQKQMREYIWAVTVDAPLFASDSGQPQASVTFRIPKLIKQQEKDDQEFGELCRKNGWREVFV